METSVYLASKNRRKSCSLITNCRRRTDLIVNKSQMDRATFNWVFTFLALNRKDVKTENSNNIYATLVCNKLFFIEEDL